MTAQLAPVRYTKGAAKGFSVVHERAAEVMSGVGVPQRISDPSNGRGMVARTLPAFVVGVTEELTAKGFSVADYAGTQR